MIIQLEKNIKERDKQGIIQKLEKIKYKTTEVITQKGDYLIGIGKKDFDLREIGFMPGIQDIHIVSDNYKLVSRKWKVNPTNIDLGDGIKIGPGHFAIMAGPCSIEGKENIEVTLDHLKENDIRIMRGGVYKPRSSPYAFRGLGLDGLKTWHQAARKAGIKIITEVMQVSQIEPMYDYIDVYQVGARNTQNFNLLDALGSRDDRIMQKRGIRKTIDA